MNDRVAAVIIQDEKILLIYRFHEGKEYYVLPGGTMENNEEVEDTLSREVFEEVNLKVAAYRHIGTYKNEYRHPRNDSIYYTDIFLGQVKLGYPELGRLSSKEIYRPEWVDLDKLPKINLVAEQAKQLVIEFINGDYRKMSGIKKKVSK